MQIQNNNYITNEKLDYLYKEKNDFESFIQNILKEFELMEEIFVIDRIENNIAVCENRSTGKMTEIEISKLPKDIKEGSVLKYENGEYKMISTPDDLPFFGHEKDINYYAYLGTYNNSDKLSFLYTPPGASNLPVQIILIPEK